MNPEQQKSSVAWTVHVSKLDAEITQTKPNFT